MLNIFTISFEMLVIHFCSLLCFPLLCFRFHVGVYYWNGTLHWVCFHASTYNGHLALFWNYAVKNLRSQLEMKIRLLRKLIIYNLRNHTDGKMKVNWWLWQSLGAHGDANAFYLCIRFPCIFCLLILWLFVPLISVFS